jgi:hypothetical protein
MCIAAALLMLAALAALGSCETFSADPGTSVDDGGVEAVAKTPYVAAVLEDQPFLYFRLGEGNASGAIIDIARGHVAVTKPGITAGVPGAIAGDRDTAFRFDGMTAAVVLDNEPAFAGKVPYTIEAWVRPTSFIAGRVFAAVQGAPFGGWAFFLDNNSRADLQREVAGMGDDDVIAPDLVPETGFHHLVGTYDGASQTVFVDGSIAATATGMKDNPAASACRS